MTQPHSVTVSTQSKQLEHYYRKRNQMREYLGGKCVVCGTVEKLEFHHKDPTQKSFSVSVLYGLTFEKLKLELDKCELRCEEHHIELHKTAKHGTRSYYIHYGCRCDECCAAQREGIREYHKRNRAIASVIGTLRRI